jgi:hypothetical protein
MGKKKINKNTTIQVKTDIYEHVKQFCGQRGMRISSQTEFLWVNLISSSMSGSVSL